MTSQPQPLVSDRSPSTLLDAFPDAVLVVDDEGQLIQHNSRAKTILGATVENHSEVNVSRLIRFGGANRLTFDDVLDIRPGTPIPCTALGMSNRNFEARVGTDANFSPGRWVLTIRDTTDRESEEQRFRESIKMEAVRALANHVGNNFNNVLAALSGRLEGAYHHLPNDSREAMTELENARADLKRAARFVRQLQRVSRPAPVRRQPVDPRKLIEDCIAAIHHESSDGITITTAFDHGSDALYANGQQLGDVIMSALQNAREAMPGGGTITIRTEVLKAGPDDPVPSERRGNDFVRITIEDTGRGIPGEVMPRIFEPFFTTKAHPGAGLGLAGVYEALKNHEGGVAVESSVGRGTTFSVYLPSSKQSPVGKARNGSGAARDETVLVIDDELAVRNILRKALQRQGYRVLEAGDGDEGLEIIRNRSEEIDLIILDIVMPRMSGWDVLKALKEFDASPPVIVQSGFTSDVEVEYGMDADAFLGKPYDLVDLTSLVRRVLDGSPDE